MLNLQKPGRSLAEMVRFGRGETRSLMFASLNPVGRKKRVHWSPGTFIVCFVCLDFVGALEMFLFSPKAQRARVRRVWWTQTWRQPYQNGGYHQTILKQNIWLGVRGYMDFLFTALIRPAFNCLNISWIEHCQEIEEKSLGSDIHGPTPKWPCKGNMSEEQVVFFWQTFVLFLNISDKEPVWLTLEISRPFLKPRLWRS